MTRTRNPVDDYTRAHAAKWLVCGVSAHGRDVTYGHSAYDRTSKAAAYAFADATRAKLKAAGKHGEAGTVHVEPRLNPKRNPPYTYDDGRDAWVDRATGKAGPNAPGGGKPVGPFKYRRNPDPYEAHASFIQAKNKQLRDILDRAGIKYTHAYVAGRASWIQGASGPQFTKLQALARRLGGLEIHESVTSPGTFWLEAPRRNPVAKRNPGSRRNPQIDIIRGNRAVVIIDQSNMGGSVWASLYVNARNGIHDADITNTSWKGRTLKGAKAWAEKVLGERKNPDGEWRHPVTGRVVVLTKKRNPPPGSLSRSSNPGVEVDFIRRLPALVVVGPGKTAAATITSSIRDALGNDLPRLRVVVTVPRYMRPETAAKAAVAEIRRKAGAQ